MNFAQPLDLLTYVKRNFAGDWKQAEHVVQLTTPCLRIDWSETTHDSVCVALYDYRRGSTNIGPLYREEAVNWLRVNLQRMRLDCTSQVIALQSQLKWVNAVQESCDVLLRES